MRIKLVEAQFYSKVKDRVEKELIPLLTDLGFNIQWDRSVYLNKFEGAYKGIYQGYDNKKVPFTVCVNTTGRGIDESLNQDAFMYIIFGGHRYDIGGFDSSNPDETLDLINLAIPDLSEKSYSIVEDLSPLKDTIQDDKGNEHTLQEWLELAKEYATNNRMVKYNEIPMEVYSMIDKRLSSIPNKDALGPNKPIILACNALLKEMK